MSSLLHLTGTPAANRNLLLQLAMGVALLVGMGLARRQRFRWHQACQTLVVLLNLALIALVMAPSFHSQQVLSHAWSHPGNGYFMIALVHAIAGTVATALAVYVVLSAGTGVLPAALRFGNFKLWMRTTLAIWLVALALGLLTYRAWYGAEPATPAAAVTGAAAETPAPAPATQATPPPQEPVIRLTNFKFTPQSVIVSAGTTVTWLDDTGTHSVCCDEERLQSEPLASGERFQHRFDRPGSYQIYCGVHGRAFMSATVNVVAGPAN